MRTRFQELLTLALFTVAVSSPAQTYSVKDLGAVPGESASKGYALNDLGQAAGTSSSPNGAIPTLGPSESVQLLIPVTRAHWFWPRLDPGECKLQVTYDPSRLRGYGFFVGNPSDVPDLWTGKLESRELKVNLKKE